MAMFAAYARDYDHSTGQFFSAADRYPVAVAPTREAALAAAQSYAAAHEEDCYCFSSPTRLSRVRPSIAVEEVSPERAALLRHLMTEGSEK